MVSPALPLVENFIEYQSKDEKRTLPPPPNHLVYCNYVVLAYF